MTACPRVVGSTLDGKDLVTCGGPLPCGIHGRVPAELHPENDVDALRAEMDGCRAEIGRLRRLVSIPVDAVRHLLDLVERTEFDDWSADDNAAYEELARTVAK